MIDPATSPLIVEGSAKNEIIKCFNANPCGTYFPELAAFVPESLAWFDEIARLRYEVHEPWMSAGIPWSSARGMSLLEIGHGLGTDLVRYGNNGALLHGVDITESHHELATRNLALHGFAARLDLCEAAEIRFPSNHFDVVHSVGVLHHTNDTVRCISEAYRLLKPGGRLILGMYHRHSVFYAQKLLWEGIAKRRLFTLGYKGLMATIEGGVDGVTNIPLVKVYGEGELRCILSDFSRVDIRVDHFEGALADTLSMVTPSFVTRAIARRLGWYILAVATK